MMLYKLDHEFFSDYITLTKIDYQRYPGSPFQIHARTIRAGLYKNPEKTIDLIWSSLSFNLVSKMFFNYNLKEYNYVSDYFHFLGSDESLFRRFYQHKFSLLTDNIFRSLPEDFKKNVFEHSVSNMSSYTDFMLDIFDNIHRNLFAVDIESILKTAVEDAEFAKEFSQDHEGLSHMFFQSLAAKINK